MAAKISLLMSVYNPDWEYFKETLDSVEAQSFHDYELVIVNDGADDQKLIEILDNYSFKKKIIKNPVNLGLPRSLNAGLKVCEGEYIARIDADDLMMPQRLSVQCELMDNNPNLVCLFSNYEVINEEGKTVGKGPDNLNKRLVKTLLYKGNCLCHSSLFVRKNIIEALGGYDEKMTYAQDYDLHLRMMKVGRLFVVPKPLIKYRKVPEMIPKNKRILSALFAYYASIKNYEGKILTMFWCRTYVTVRELRSIILH